MAQRNLRERALGYGGGEQVLNSNAGRQGGTKAYPAFAVEGGEPQRLRERGTLVSSILLFSQGRVGSGSQPYVCHFYKERGY